MNLKVQERRSATAPAGDVPLVSAPARLRRELRAARRALGARQQRRHALALARRFGHSLMFLRARRIGAYWPTDGELDPRPLLALAWRRGRESHLPVLPVPRRGAQGRRLQFARWAPGEPLRPNRFGIPEPQRRGAVRRLARQLDLLLIPLVGFDAAGHRLGMGGGFYDRTLAGRRLARHWRRPRLIGLAHECQRRERIPRQPWDIPLDLVLTERRAYPARG